MDAFGSRSPRLPEPLNFACSIGVHLHMAIRRLEKSNTRSVRAIGVLSLVTICGVAPVIGSAQRNVAALQVSAPPAFASQQPLPKPPPVDVRETRVLPLDSEHCTASDTLLFDSRSAEVLARCERNAPTTPLFVTVVLRTAAP